MSRDDDPIPPTPNLPAVRKRSFLARFLGRRRTPLRLLAVPKDPVAGDKIRGEQLMAGGFVFGPDLVEIESLDGGGGDLPTALAHRFHAFAWLRDLAAATTHERGSPTGERLARAWLNAHGKGPKGVGAEPAWRPDIAGRRTLFATAYAPYILSTRDTAYRAGLLGALTEAAKQTERGADRATQPGLARIIAWAGAVAASLVIQGAMKPGRAEAGLARALKTGLHDDGGLVSRSPIEQRELVEILGMLRTAYFAGERAMPAWLTEAEEGALSALLCVALGDAALSSWQGGNPGDAKRLVAAVESASEDARPLRQARGWGYQRLQAKDIVIIVDAAPPPPDSLNPTGSASTLAFEMSEGQQRIVVNCGGPGERPDSLGEEFVHLLRSTAAHSTLTLADTNSTAVLEAGGLGKGVTSLDMERDAPDGGARVIATHDGYAKGFGFNHRRSITLAADGKSLVGEDELLPVGRRKSGDETGFAVRFHLGSGVEAAPTADGRGALLRARGAKSAWQFRCRGGLLTVEDSLWIDGDGAVQGTLQLVVTGTTPPEGQTVGWEFQRAG